MKKHIVRIFALVLASLALFTACAKKGQSVSGGIGSEKKYVGERKVGSNTVKVWEGDEILEGYDSVAFEETEALCADNEGQGWVILEEPLKGGLPSLGYTGVFPEVKSISLSTGWSCFEESPGVYDWTVMDETIEYWAKQGKTINMRLCTDGLELNQGVINGAPAWLYEAPYNVPKVIVNGDVFADLSNKTYQEQLRKFLNEFASHYTAEDYPYRDRIEVVELRGYGMVGEWHSGWNTYASVEERTQTLCETIDIWREAWGDKLLVLSCTYEFLNQMWGVTNAQSYEDFMYWMGYDHALQLENISFRRDGIAFGLQEYDKRMAIDYFYMNTGLPLLGEIGDGYYKHTDDDAYPLFESLNEALYRWRVNYQSAIGWVAQEFGTVIENEEELIDYFSRKMGYRLVPNRMQFSNQVKSGSKFYLNSLWSNRAMGRCWTDHDLTVYFENSVGETVYQGTNERFNPVSINNGEPHFFNLSFDLPKNLAKGEYTVKFAVTDGTGVPKIELPIAGNDGSDKYYLGKVKVGNKEAESVYETDALDGGENSKLSVVNQGKLTDRLVNVDGSKAVVGSGSGVFALGQELKNGETYYITFDYKTDKAKEDISITDGSRYVVGAYNEKSGAWGDSYKWLDVSNQVSHRSVTVAVPDDGKDYVLAFGGVESVAAIAIDNVTVETANLIESSFRIDRSYTADLGGGAYEIRSTYLKTWADGLQLRERLNSHTTYMLTFDAKTTADISGGGFFYVNMVDPNVNYKSKYAAVEAFSKDHIGSFYTPEDYGFTKYSFVFNTKDYGDGWHVNFGVYARGAYQIKNITLTCIGTDYSFASNPVECEHNVIPDKNVDVNTQTVYENFEAGVFNGGIMHPGYRSSGIIRKGKYNVSGDYSCYIINTDSSLAEYEFNVFCMTNVRDVVFSPNTVYKVKFKFMIIEDVRKEEGGRFYAHARRDGDYTHDTGAFEWHGYDGYEIGQVYSVEYEFKTNAAEGNYQFMWGVHNYGAIVIDDVVFERVNSSTANQTPRVTLGHAYSVSQEVLYRNN